MAESLIIGYGIVLDDTGRVMLLRRRSYDPLWPGQWWLPGDVTPLSEEPDDTVPRLFEHLLRQRVRAAYAHTVTGTEPNTGRHCVHNGYLVTVQEALDGEPDDESNPFDAIQWWTISEAIAALPDQQSELLSVILERLNTGWTFEDDSGLDDLFAESTASPPAQPSLAANVEALLRLAVNAAADLDANLDLDLQAARNHGWSWSELEQAMEIARPASVSREPA